MNRVKRDKTLMKSGYRHQINFCSLCCIDRWLVDFIPFNSSSFHQQMVYIFSPKQFYPSFSFFFYIKTRMHILRATHLTKKLLREEMEVFFFFIFSHEFIVDSVFLFFSFFFFSRGEREAGIE